MIPDIGDEELQTSRNIMPRDLLYRCIISKRRNDSVDRTTHH
jgi:hypothetical protein